MYGTSWIMLWMLHRVERKVDVKVWPIQVMRLRSFDMSDGLDRRSSEPGKRLKGQKEFAVINQDPEAVAGDVRHLNR